MHVYISQDQKLPSPYTVTLVLRFYWLHYYLVHLGYVTAELESHGPGSPHWFFLLCLKTETELRIKTITYWPECQQTGIFF